MTRPFLFQRYVCSNRNRIVSPDIRYGKCQKLTASAVRSIDAYQDKVDARRIHHAPAEVVVVREPDADRVDHSYRLVRDEPAAEHGVLQKDPAHECL